MKAIKFGDILSVNEGIIVQGCNAQGVMGSGLAKAIREKYPEVYEEYKIAFEDASSDRRALVGSAQAVQIKSKNNLYVVNGITQEFYGKDGRKYVSYSAIQAVFAQVAIMAKSKQLEVHYPMIGAGLGGGDWAVISEIIDTVFQDSGIKRTLWISE